MNLAAAAPGESHANDVVAQTLLLCLPETTTEPNEELLSASTSTVASFVEQLPNCCYLPTWLAEEEQNERLVLLLLLHEILHSESVVTQPSRAAAMMEEPRVVVHR